MEFSLFKSKSSYKSSTVKHAECLEIGVENMRDSICYARNFIAELVSYTWKLKKQAMILNLLEALLYLYLWSQAAHFSYCRYDLAYTYRLWPLNWTIHQGRIFRFLNRGLPGEWSLDRRRGIHLETSQLNKNLNIHWNRGTLSHSWTMKWTILMISWCLGCVFWPKNFVMLVKQE